MWNCMDDVIYEVDHGIGESTEYKNDTADVVGARRWGVRRQYTCGVHPLKKRSYFVKWP